MIYNFHCSFKFDSDVVSLYVIPIELRQMVVDFATQHVNFFEGVVIYFHVASTEKSLYFGYV